MTSLPAVIRKAGFELTMIRRAGRVILLQVRHTDHNGRPVEPYEGYPAAESWGRKAWTFTSLARAVQKLEQLAQKASCRGTVGHSNRFEGQGQVKEQAHG
jgi:hypothetical protein